MLAAIVATGCGAPQFNYATDSSAGAYFKVPHDWHQIDAASLTAQLNAMSNGFGDQAGLWDTAYDASGDPTAGHVLDPGATSPFAFAFVVPLGAKASDAMSYNLLRDFILPVPRPPRGSRPSRTASRSPSSAAGQRQWCITPGRAFTGSGRSTATPIKDGRTDTFDQVALTNSNATMVYLLLVHCLSTCYSENSSEINTVMQSFTVRSHNAKAKARADTPEGLSDAPRAARCSRGTRKRLSPWDRIKFLVLLTLLWWVLVWAAMANNPLVSFNDALRIEAGPAPGSLFCSGLRRCARSIS